MDYTAEKYNNLGRMRADFTLGLSGKLCNVKLVVLALKEPTLEDRVGNRRAC